MSMKPIRIFFFGLLVLLILCIISVLFADHPPVILGYSVKIPSFTYSITNQKTNYKDISQILKLSKLIGDTSQSTIVDTTKKSSCLIKPQRIVNYRIKSNFKADSIRYIIREIEFPAGQDSLLFPFFRELNNLKDDNKLIRILHYGDSQIEGDRITSYLRNQLQTQFGGNGIGLLPIIATNPASMSYVYDISDNWIKVSPFQSSSEAHNFNKFGALINFAKMKSASGLYGKEKELEGWIKLQHSNLSYPLTQNFQICRVLYGFNKSPMMIQLLQNKQLLDAELLTSSSGLSLLQWTIQWPVNDISIVIKSTYTPYIFGIALDGKSGVAVDNIPLRGSSGLEFTKMDPAFLHDFYKLLNVKLLILQFGVNIVPNVTENYDYYYRAFLQQLKLLKQYNQDLSIIVLGVSDVSRIGKNGFESYPNIEKIRDVQKRAAFESGCAFWDIYEAMGGQNSMPSWVFADPPLAQKDFVHFNPMGAKIIGEMFYRSFMQENNKYMDTNKLVDQ